MRFQITLNMPSHQGKSVHQITAEYECGSLQEFCDVLRSSDFIVVREFYRFTDANTAAEVFEDKGEVILNCFHVGKVKVSKETRT
jgi:hypothetical protein